MSDLVNDALGLLALVVGQDVGPAPSSDGAPAGGGGRWRIARKVAPDRVISTVDPETRHTRKSKSNRKDNYRGHAAAEPETGLITDCEMTKASGQAGSDAVVGEQMISHDRCHQTGTQAAIPSATPGQPHHPQPANQQPEDHRPDDQQHPDGERLRLTAPHRPVRPPRRTPSPRASSEPTPLARDQGREVHAESAYCTGEARAAYRRGGHDTVIRPKPLRPAVDGGFILDEFTIDEQAGTVTCPGGHTRSMSATRTVTFGKLCAGCPLRPLCTTATDGRSMTIHPTRSCCGPLAPRPAPRSSHRPTPPDRRSNGSSPGPRPKTGGVSSSATSAPAKTTPGYTPGAPR